MRARVPGGGISSEYWYLMVMVLKALSSRSRQRHEYTSSLTTSRKTRWRRAEHDVTAASSGTCSKADA